MSSNYDVAIIGAGFGGILALRRLRDAGFNVRGFERKDSLGGVWRENAYPGAAVDSQSPLYQFYDEALLQTFDWKEEFPTRSSMAKYFKHVDEMWEISEHFEFNIEVKGANFCEKAKHWKLQLAGERTVTARWLMPAVGMSSVVNIPPIPGIDSFSGKIHHTALWPRDGVDLNNKRVAIIGTGPSGVQVIQAAGKVAESMVVYQRTPALTLPKYSSSRGALSSMSLDDSKRAFLRSNDSFTAFNHTLRPESTFDVPAEQRGRFYDELHKQGGWSFWMSAFQDMWYDTAANLEAYSFWANTTRTRIKDCRKRDLAVPLKPDRPFGVKRPCLEEHLYEVYDQPNVDLVDVSQDSIEEITSRGVRVNGQEKEFDVIVLATGFSGETSGLNHLNVVGTKNHSLETAWGKGVRSSFGLAVHDFPNMFYLYGPQCPTLLVNAPSVIAVQVSWLCQLLKNLREEGVTRFEATDESEQSWMEKLKGHWSKSLFCLPPPWSYCEDKVPGGWVGGLPVYRNELGRCLAEGCVEFDRQ